MAIIDNVDLVVTYDGNFQVVSARILPNELPDDDEHAAQCVAIEMLRGLMASGMSVQDYNNTTDEDLQPYRDQAVFRASLNVTAPVNHLDSQQKYTATGLGENFFEHGYQFIMDGTSAGDKVQFTKLGGL